MERAQYRIVIEDTFFITGRGLVIVGSAPSEVVDNGDHVRIELANGSTLTTDHVFVELHAPAGKISLALPELTKEQVPVGSVLTGPL